LRHAFVIKLMRKQYHNLHRLLGKLRKCVTQATETSMQSLRALSGVLLNKDADRSLSLSPLWNDLLTYGMYRTCRL